MSLIFSEGGIGGVTEEELQKAVDELQSQIDTISAASDCTDIVGTYTDLQNYDTSTLTDKDIIKVLNDTTHNGQPSYYRWSSSTDQFTYIGSEERVNDGTLTIKYGAETVGTFSANQSTNATVNLPETDLTNYYDKTETDELLDEKQDSFEGVAPLNLAPAGKIGNVYKYGQDIIVEDGIVQQMVNIIDYQYSTSGLPTVDFSKPWELRIDDIVFTGESTSNLCYVHTGEQNTSFTFSMNSNNKLHAYAYQYNGTYSDRTVTITPNASYDLSISYDGSGVARCLYKLSSADTWTEVTGFRRTLSNENSSQRYIYIGAAPSRAPINTNNITFTNDGNILFARTSSQLSLSIGSGLAVQGGNLVNTNPTAPAVMTGATSSTAGTAGLAPAPAVGDDVKFLSGDGTYKVATTDMSDYYNKTQTNNLLNTKIDTTAPVEPLVYDVQTSQVESITLTGDSTEFYSTNQSTGASLGYYSGQATIQLPTTSLKKLDPTKNIIYTFPTFDCSQTGQTPVIQKGVRAFTNENTFAYMPIFGYIDENGEFSPKMAMIGSQGYNKYYTMYMFSGGTATSSSTLTTWTFNGSSQVFSSGGSSTIYSGDGPGFNKHYLYYSSSVGLLYFSRLKNVTGNDGTLVNITTGFTTIPNDFKVNAVIVNGVYNIPSSSPWSVANTGAYNSGGEKIWGVADVSEIKTFRLNIGAGLAVQNGNLVNTNPTPVDVSTKVTGTGVTDIKALTQTEYEALTTPDATTMYVLTDAGAIYLGTILIANNATSGGGIQTSSSLAPSINTALGSITTTAEIQEGE